MALLGTGSGLCILLAGPPMMASGLILWPLSALGVSVDHQAVIAMGFFISTAIYYFVFCTPLLVWQISKAPAVVLGMVIVGIHWAMFMVAQAIQMAG